MSAGSHWSFKKTIYKILTVTLQRNKIGDKICKVAQHRCRGGNGDVQYGVEQFPNYTLLYIMQNESITVDNIDSVDVNRKDIILKKKLYYLEESNSKNGKLVKKRTI